MGERVGRRWRRRGRLSGSDRSHWFSVVHQARRSDLPLQWPRGEEGMCGVVGRAPAFLRPAVCSAGSTIQYFGADLWGESIQCTFTPMTFLREDGGGDDHMCWLYNLEFKDDWRSSSLYSTVEGNALNISVSSAKLKSLSQREDGWLTSIILYRDIFSSGAHSSASVRISERSAARNEREVFALPANL